MTAITGKSVEVSIPYYEGPFNPPDRISSLTTARYADWRQVIVTDTRPSVSSYTLDKNGFQYVKHASALSGPPYDIASWKDHALREQVSDAEISTLAKSVTGAKKIMILLVTGRNAPYTEPEDQPPRHDICSNHKAPLPPTRAKGFYDGLDMGPVRKPHIDWGIGAVRSILREWSEELADEAKDVIEAEDEAAKLPGGIEKNYKGRR